VTGQRIIDPHVHLWDPRTTPRQITPLVKLLGRFPNVLERVGRALTSDPARRVRRRHAVRHERAPADGFPG
jgi:predicted TIM-barrel fold metal-dependent hydrolase